MDASFASEIGNYFSMEFKIEEIILNKIVQDLDVAVHAVEGLQELGYTRGFELHGLRLKCREIRKCYRQVDFIVDEIYTMEETSISDKKFSIYALRHLFENVKGILMTM